MDDNDLNEALWRISKGAYQQMRESSVRLIARECAVSDDVVWRAWRLYRTVVQGLERHRVDEARRVLSRS